jgi:hypothetical protein
MWLDNDMTQTQLLQYIASNDAKLLGYYKMLDIARQHAMSYEEGRILNAIGDIKNDSETMRRELGALGYQGVA